MSAVYPQVVCARVREQVSLELDSELSQLEQRMLAAHLERCAECAVYAADVRDLTERIRSAPLHTMRRPVVVRRHRSLAATRLQIGAAAALALAALGLGTELAVTPEPRRARSRASRAGRISRRRGACTSRSRRSFGSSRPADRSRRRGSVI